MEVVFYARVLGGRLEMVSGSGGGGNDVGCFLWGRWGEVFVLDLN